MYENGSGGAVGFLFTGVLRSRTGTAAAGGGVYQLWPANRSVATPAWGARFGNNDGCFSAAGAGRLLTVRSGSAGIAIGVALMPAP